ncbi:MAG: hypothetical protein HC869_25745 [Rhodospirillales bacterium]|nr:hypothetical protein [Rhodospirillales bacterium]
MAVAEPFVVRRQVLYWFRARPESFDSFRPQNFPVYVWQLRRLKASTVFRPWAGLRRA